MTHTLHRAGTATSLGNDFVVFAMGAQNVNRDGCAPRLRRIFEKMLEFEPVNYGDMKTGNKFSVGNEKILESIKDNSIVHAVFTSAEKVAEVLKALKELDAGMSVVVSGVLEATGECCGKVGLHRHTVEHSLGIWGNIARLTEQEVLHISTMCGHGMVAFSLIKYMVEEIKAGRTTPGKASEELSRMCHCGVMNPVRAAELLTLMTS
ncbi:MAG: hypothetical protein VR68_01055 [Peptococcaceae bacterium BRH_c4a]|nr:MAG: hypothetical protein VR68_01055 [Peptococcaceae bacterium BRH_c4a]